MSLAQYQLAMMSAVDVPPTIQPIFKNCATQCHSSATQRHTLPHSATVPPSATQCHNSATEDHSATHTHTRTHGAN